MFAVISESVCRDERVNFEGFLVIKCSAGPRSLVDKSVDS